MAGRPKRVFTEDERANIERYARDNCNTETIADATMIPVNTLKRHFGRKLTHWRACGKVELKHNQRELAKTNSQMAVHLGKNELGQVDKQTIVTEPIGHTMTEPKQEAAKAGAEAYKQRIIKMEGK